MIPEKIFKMTYIFDAITVALMLNHACGWHIEFLVPKYEVMDQTLATRVIKISDVAAMFIEARLKWELVWLNIQYDGHSKQLPNIK